MKIALFFIYMMAFSPSTTSQTVAKKVANEACSCIGAEVERDVVEEKMQKCLPSALAKVLEEGNKDEKKILSTVGGVEEIIFQAKKLLAENCQVIRERDLELKKDNFYASSLYDKANDYFWEGNDYLEKGLFAKAARKFKQAIKEDENFVLAMDHLAISYRKMEDYDKAIKWYARSLSIFPEGEVALLNIAIAHFLKNEFNNSAEYYQQFASVYPKSPEGYFGLGKVFILSGEYERALENVLIAHRLYVEEESEYVHDSQQLIGFLYQKFNDLNKDDVFISRAEKHGIEISLNDR